MIETKCPWCGKPVKVYGDTYWTGLPLYKRIILLPIYMLIFGYYCLVGKEIEVYVK